MKIAPVPQTANLAPAPIDQNTGSAVQNLRSLKMRTNFNPSDYAPLDQENEAPPLDNPPINEDRAGVAEDTQPLSPQYAALAKQRRALQVKERELREKEKALSNSPAQGDSIEIARLKSEPLKVLLEAGVTYDDLTQAILNDPGNSELHQLRQEFNSYKQQVSEQFDQREAAAEKQALMEMENEARDLVQNSEDFELIRSLGHVPDVTRLIERQYRADGTVLPVRKACEMIEEELFKDAQRIAGLNKVRAQFPAQQPPQMQRHGGMKTLTNRDTANIPLTAKQRAIAAFQGTLKR